MKDPEPDASTPIDPDEARALIPSHIATQAALNEWEHENILAGERWAFARRRRNLLTADYMKQLHRKMFGATWKWAGEWRATEKNIGVAPEAVPATVRQLLQDVESQLDSHSYPVREIAVRLHHRLVWIHPFPNGNGRFARTYADLLLAADARDYAPLLRFLDVV